MASESRAITVVEQQKNGSKEPAKQNIKNDDSEEGFTVIRNFRKVYKRNWRQMSAISSGKIDFGLKKLNFNTNYMLSLF